MKGRTVDKNPAKPADFRNPSRWHWYERIAESVAADGLGDAEPAKSVCVGCHAGAGSDAAHAVTGSSDFVYLQVAP